MRGDRQEMDAAVRVGLTKPETRGKVLSADLVVTGSRAPLWPPGLWQRLK